jgi:hypothetical protein
MPLFKFQSMSGAIVMRSGGPISWKVEQQERTSLICVRLKYELPTPVHASQSTLKRVISSLSSLSYPIRDTITATPLYNNNKACIKLCHNMTTKGNCHIEQRENAVQEWVANSTLTVLHVSGKTNISPTFSPKKCVMVQTSDASEILSCATQAITTSASTVLLTALLCLPTRCSILNCLVLAFLMFSSLTAAFILWRPPPAFQAAAAISILYYILSSFAGSNEQSCGVCSYVVYSYRLLLT